MSMKTSCKGKSDSRWGTGTGALGSTTNSAPAYKRHFRVWRKRFLSAIAPLLVSKDRRLPQQANNIREKGRMRAQGWAKQVYDAREERNSRELGQLLEWY
jgi:hypothetical protein